MKIDATLTLNYDNGEKLEKQLATMVKDGGDEMVGAIYEVMEEVKNLSLELVPYRLGDLKASAVTHGVQVHQSGTEGFIVIGYGTAYAVLQHETPPANEAPPPKEGHGSRVQTFHHADGKTWKYLQRPMEAAIPGLETRIAERVKKRLGA